MASRVVVLVPLRGGSKGIPGKNIKPLGGRPLCAWTLEAACGAKHIDQVFVSTDSAEITGVVGSLKLPVSIVQRPAELATDTASTESVMLHLASQIPFDVLVTLQATSPLTTSEDIDLALEKFDREHLDSLVTGVLQKRFYWTPSGQPLNYDPLHRPRRQDWAGTILENGAFYITRRSVLEQTRCRLGGRIGVYAMPPETAVEIDDPEDWLSLQRMIVQRKQADLGPVLRQIRLVMVDVDGTLTDGGMYYSAEGEIMKRFDTRDAVGLHRLEEAGVAVVIVTRENSSIAEARARKLNLPCRIGITDKCAMLEELCREHHLQPGQIGVIGDDLNDLDCMKKAGFAACPNDAQPCVKACCHWIASSTGGHGAVREIAELLLRAI